MDVTVECQKRPEGSKPRALRRSGKIPAVLYGHKGAESIDLTVDAKDAEILLKKAGVNHTPVKVKVPELNWSGTTIIREAQTHPWKNQVYHLSFFSLARQDSVQLVVPLNLVGESPGVKEGGIMDQVMTEIQVQCAPDSIPEAIEIDVSNMELGYTMHLHELVVPKSVTLLEDSERTVLSIVAPAVSKTTTTEEEEAAAEAPAAEAPAAEPEV
ncbi:MAG: 50S ribosomal protein L25/general stress protein Ctc [Coleofasciculaceae cyanobacterium]